MRERAPANGLASSHLWGRLAAVATCLAALVAGQVFVSGCGSSPARSAGEPCTLEDCLANLCQEANCLDMPVSQGGGGTVESEPEDSDYLPRAEEAQLGTEATDPDTDGDGWIDGFEVVHVLTPHDEDGDGTHDALESRLGDRDGDCLVDQKDPDDDTPLTDLAALGELGCCCYGPCSAWEVEVSSASCAVAEDGSATLQCPEGLQEDSDADGVADPCDLCPLDPKDQCDRAPHGLASDPPSPGGSLTPTITGHAFWAQFVSLYTVACDGETLVADQVPVDAQGRFAASITVAEDATTTIVARAHRIGGNVSGPSEPLRYTHPDLPLLELEHDAGWTTHLISNSSSVTFRVTAPSPAVDWSLFPLPGCAVDNTAWGSGMSGLNDTISLDSGHINLGPKGTETAFSARVEYADGTQSGCSDAAVYVRGSASPAVVAWLVSPDDPSQVATSKAASGNGPMVTLRVVATDDVTEVSIFADEDCTSDLVATRSIDASPSDVSVHLVAAFGVTLGDDTSTQVPLSVMATGGGKTSECVAALTYTHDPVPPAPPTVIVEVEGVEVHGEAEAGGTLTVFAGPGCDGCLPLQTISLVDEGEATYTYQLTWDAADLVPGYSALVIDAAGNVSPCAESTGP